MEVHFSLNGSPVNFVLEMTLQALKESLRLQGSRGLDLRRATSGDTPLYQVPELKLNMCMVSELFVQILATALGVFVVVWATAVLLGGFGTLVPHRDFWVIAGIVAIQTARLVGLNVSPEAEFFNQVPPAFLVLVSEHYATWGRRRIFCYIYMLISSFDGCVLIIMGFLAILVLAVQLAAVAISISLSILRLFALSIYHDNAFVFHGLLLLYVLVLLQGGLFIIWLLLRMYRFQLADHLVSNYGFENKRELIDKYMDRTMSTAIKNGLSSTISRNLASFAADLMKSEYSQDHIDAVLVIHTLTSQEDHRTRTLSQIQASPLCVSRLIGMVNSKRHTDQSTKICIAEIVAHLASNLRLADISGATESISSMIDPHFTNLSTPATNVNIDNQTAIVITVDQQGAIPSASATNGGENIGFCIYVKILLQRGLAWWKKLMEIISNRQQETLQSDRNTSGAESKPLIIHGLLILAKLAVNPDNCKQIYDYKGLFSKIISPLKNKVYEIPRDDGITMEITEKALKVLSMLVSGTDEINGKIRRDLCSSGILVKDIRSILERNQMYNTLKVPATKILTELSLDMSTQATLGLDYVAEFIKVLLDIFFHAANDSDHGTTAGEALAVLAMDNVNCSTIMNFSTAGTETSVQLLTDMIPAANKLSQTAIAQLLMQFCANSDSAERECLTSVKTILHEMLKVICNVEQAPNANQSNVPQHNLGQQQATNTNQVGSAQQNPGQQQSANANQSGSPEPNLGQHQAANTYQTRLHNLGQLLFSQALHFHISIPCPRRFRTANRNAPSDNMPLDTQHVGARRKSLAACLGLALQICDTLEISADDFDTALAGIPLSMGEFVDKLNDIIELRKGHSVDTLEWMGPSVCHLIIIKTVTKLCTWMMRIKPDCITEFQNKNTSTKLQGALEDMRDLELSMLLTGRAGDMANYETLSTIVAAARQQMDANVQV